MKKNVLLPLITLLLASAASINVHAADKSTKTNEKVAVVVTKVLDGDTIQGVINGKNFATIRLADVDCAESTKKSRKLPKQIKEWNMSEDEILKQGKQSKEKMDALLKLYKGEIYFTETPEKVCKTGNSDRLVGVIYAKDINVNEFMLKDGNCRPFVCKE